MPPAPLSAVLAGHVGERAARVHDDVKLLGRRAQLHVHREHAVVAHAAVQLQPRVQPYSVNVLLATVITVSYSLQL